MTKPNRLISILLSVIMLVSLFPQAIFAADGPVAKIGSTEYETLEDAFFGALDYEDGTTPVVIELLRNLETDRVLTYCPVTVKMNGHSITLSAPEPGGDANFLSIYHSSTFENGTINGNVAVNNDFDTPTAVTITAPDGEDFAVNGNVYVNDETASLKISGARVGINGTFKTYSPDIDISGTVRAVDLSEEIKLLGSNSSNKIVGAAETGGTMSDVTFENGTYMVGNEPAKQIKIEEAGAEPAKPSPTILTNNVKIYAGQEGKFDISFDGTEKLNAYVQKNGLNDNITTTLSEDQKTVTVSVSKDFTPKDPDKIDIGETFTLYVHVVGDALRQAKTEFTIIKCSHKNVMEDDSYGNSDTVCKCEDCGINMIKRTQFDTDNGWAKEVKYFETIDEAIDAIPAFNPRYQYSVVYYEDIELDHDLEVNDKSFELMPCAPDHTHKLSFTDGHSMKISRNTINDENRVYLRIVKNIGDITLGKNGYLQADFDVTIDKLTLADETADISELRDPDFDSPMTRIKKLSVTAPDCTLADFLEYDDITLGYRGYSYIDSRNEYAFDYFYNETYQKYIDNVVIAEAPIQKFTAELDEASKNAVYPDDVIINASVKSGNAVYTVDLPRNLTCDWTESKQSSTNSKLTLSKVPAGTYDNIIVYAIGSENIYPSR